MPRTTRNQTKRNQEQLFNSLTRKINSMSPTKKRKLKRVITKYNNTRKKIKSQEKKEKLFSKKLKQKFGRYSKNYTDIATRLNPVVTEQILTMTKELETYENNIKKELKNLNKQKERLQKNITKLQDNLNNKKREISNMQSPGWRERNISPNVLRNINNNFQLTRINNELSSEKTEIEQKLIKESKKLEKIEKDLLKLK
tara:strand:+ start:1219 stop:1815 length:597 start_codon:yes stop_codon:yes gene_type:complete